MNRRTFFKTVAATLAAGTAVAVVAPAVVRGGDKEKVTLKGSASYYRGRLYFVNDHCELQTVEFSGQSGYIVTPYENPNPKTS